MTEYDKYTVENLKRLRHWFAGFEAAGGKLPVNIGGLTDPLRRAIQYMEGNRNESDT